MSQLTTANVPLVGGHPALDLLNTVERAETDAPIDLLADWPALLAWAPRAGVLDPEEAAALAAAPRGPEELARVRELREALRSALAGGGFEPLRAAWLDALAHAELTTAPVLTPCWPRDAALVRRRLAAAAFALLADAQLRERVGHCHGDGCGGAFLDSTRNRSRRYCSTAGCGNRERVRRHRQSRRA
jgi:predicted RNA-binding Zn ribbon-like protein